MATGRGEAGRNGKVSAQLETDATPQTKEKGPGLLRGLSKSFRLVSRRLVMRGLLVPVFPFRQLLERVFGRRAGQGPFQRVGIFVPRVVLGHFRAAEQRVEHHAEEEEEAGEGQERAQRRPVVPDPWKGSKTTSFS